ncbi:ubiquitin-associated UBA domain protein [Nitzschia inconspicua]|uniref:Ubiquitin-associated UBA domain protein n=1 Tax=Nitzschia inconspicua TaxID=303405 RepID=A0A9K3KM34_9STRA|nr:ubiquitin-associated UBA domain protein [Nitzschia inconspicua]
MPPAAGNAVSGTGNANNTWRRNNNGNANLTPVSFSSASSSQHPPFFLGAPITKSLCIIWALGSFWIIRTSTPSEREYDYINNMSNTSGVSLLFKNIIKACYFVNPSEAMVGLAFLANYMRRLERELSSRRMVVWLMTIEAVFVLSQMVAIATLDSEVAYGFTSQVRGPYWIAGGVLYWYWMYVPRLHPRFLSLPTCGMVFSEKSFGFAWAAYVLLMGGGASLLVGLLGFLGSALFFFLLMLPSTSSNNGTGSNSNQQLLPMDVPDSIVNMLPWDALGSILLVENPPKVFAPLLVMNAGRNNNVDIGMGAGLGQRRQWHVRPQPTAPPLPPPEAIAQLTAMGFGEQQVKEALQATGNNVERAADRLLTG